MRCSPAPRFPLHAALLCLGRSPGTGRDEPPFPGSEALVPRGSPAFRPVSWSGEAATHLHIEDGLWDRDGTSRFPPCLGAHRFEELFCFLDFFSPCFPPESSRPIPPRGHRLLTRPLSPSDTSEAFPNSGPRVEAAGEGRAAGPGPWAPDNHSSPPALAAPPHGGLHWNVSQGKASLPFLALHARTQTP